MHRLITVLLLLGAITSPIAAFPAPQGEKGTLAEYGTCPMTGEQCVHGEACFNGLACKIERDPLENLGPQTEEFRDNVCTVTGSERDQSVELTKIPAAQMWRSDEPLCRGTRWHMHIDGNYCLPYFSCKLRQSGRLRSTADRGLQLQDRQVSSWYRDSLRGRRVSRSSK